MFNVPRLVKKYIKQREYVKKKQKDRYVSCMLRCEYTHKYSIIYFLIN